MGANDGSIIFAFLIIFLGLFGVFLFGGLAWHYVRATRHAMLLSSLIRSEHAKTWSAGKPVLRDVHVNTPRACLGSFEYDLPIAAQPHAPPHHHSTPEESEIEPETTDLLTVDLSTWGILKWAVRYFPGAFRRRVRDIVARRVLGRPAPAPAVPSRPSGSADDLLEVSPDVKELAVSVMIAMPAPPRQHPEGGEEVLDEYLLGITRLPFR